VDHYGFAPGLGAEIGDCLAAMDGVDPPRGKASDPDYLFHDLEDPLQQDWKRTLIARAVLGNGRLRVETNSVERADRLRERIEAACSGRIAHRTREHSDPLALMERRQGQPAPQPGPAVLPADEANTLVLEFKRRHYADWGDHPLPALGGKTPRAAVRTQAGREQVDLLLKECEMMEARGPEGQRFDFSVLRGELGLLD
jgi:hypothetical protein